MSSVVSPTERAPYRLSAPAVRDHAAELTVAGLTVIAFALRVSQVHQTLVGDEMLAYSEIARHSLGQTLHLVHTGVESSPPLFFVLAWLSVKLGDPTVWIRLPSLVLGTATVPVVYAIGRVSIGRLAGLIGAAVIAVTPFSVYYGIEARPYATMTFFVAVSTLALLRAVSTRSARWWVVYVLSAAAAAYSHYTCVFVLAAQAAWSVWACRDRVRQPLIASAAIVLLYLPWLPNLHGKQLSTYAKLYPLGVRRVLTDLLRPIPGHPAAPLRAIPTKLGLAVVAACALGGAVALMPRLREQRFRSPSLVLLAALAAATPVGVLLYSLIVKDIWIPRDLSASLPAIALLLGALLAALPRPLTAGAMAAVMVVLTVGTIRSFEPQYARGPFRSIATYLDHVANQHDPVIIISWLGTPAIPAQFHKQHLITRSLTSTWQATGRGGVAYVVLDDTIARLLRITTPHPRGFQLIGRKHYAGAFPTDLLSYRRGPAAQ